MICRSFTVKSLLLRAGCLKGGFNAVQWDFGVKRDFFFPQQLALAEQHGSAPGQFFSYRSSSLADSASLISSTGFGPFVGTTTLWLLVSLCIILVTPPCSLVAFQEPEQLGKQQTALLPVLRNSAPSCRSSGTLNLTGTKSLVVPAGFARGWLQTVNRSARWESFSFYIAALWSEIPLRWFVLEISENK